MTRRPSILAFLLLAPARALADDEADEATVRLRHAPATESVVGHAELERTGAVSLADALRPQADIDLPGGGAAGSVGRLTLRGGAPEETLLVVDGLRVGARSTAAVVAGADPNLVPVALLQRVSILRGPTSALWGANAVTGVFELTTREPVAPRMIAGTVQYAAYLSPDDDDDAPAPMPGAMPDDDDDDDFEEGLHPFFGARGQVLAAVREGARYTLAAVSAGTTRGWAPNTSARLVDGTVKVGRVLAGGGTAYLWARGFDSYTGAPSWGSLLAADVFDADDRIARQGAQLAGVLRRALGARLQLEAALSASIARATLYNPDADTTAGTTAVESRQDSSELQGRVALVHESSALGTLTAGVDFGREGLDAEGFGAPSAVRGAAFARVVRPIGPVTLDVAARLDADSQFGLFASPRVGLRAGAPESLARAEVAVGRGFRPPTFSERAWPVFVYGSPSGGAVGERGNAALRPEDAWGLDAAVSLGGGARRWQASARGFGMRVDDMIRWAVGSDGYWTPTNTARAWTAGASVEGTVRLLPRLSLVASGFWQTTRDDAGDEVPGRLRAKVTGRVVWFARTGLRAWAEALWFDRAGVDATGAPWQGVFVNARVGWQFEQGVGVFALGENLLGTRFESVRGLPTPGRVVWLGVAVDLDED